MHEQGWIRPEAAGGPRAVVPGRKPADLDPSAKEPSAQKASVQEPSAQELSAREPDIDHDLAAATPEEVDSDRIDRLAGLPNPRVLGLAADVAANIRFEAARRGLTQGDLAGIITRSRAAVSARWHCQVPWTIEEVGRVARAMGMRPGDLLAVPAPVQRYEW